MFRASFQLVLNRISKVALLILLMATGARAADYRALYKFTCCHAYKPLSGVVADAAGNIYGTTEWGGNYDGYGGTVYELSAATGFRIIYAFGGLPDGLSPQGNLAIDSAGNLYGTTLGGGTSKQCEDGCGTVFKLTPPSNGGMWTETILYSFCSATSCTDGAYPVAGVILDSAGNLYGTAPSGGVGGATDGCGTVFELTPSPGGPWTETVLFSPDPLQTNLCHPQGSLVFDGNVYGAVNGAQTLDPGEIFELSPQSGGGWAYTPVWAFNSGLQNGAGPTGGLVFDAFGNLYGTTGDGGDLSCGQEGCGTVFELSPRQDGQWTGTILHSFRGGTDGAYPNGNLVLDAAGNVYGTTFGGGSTGQFCSVTGCGTVFEMTPDGNGHWTENLFRFPSDMSLGAQPNAPLLLDGAGHAYGTTSEGGPDGPLGGVVFQFTQ